VEADGQRSLNLIALRARRRKEPKRSRDLVKRRHGQHQRHTRERRRVGRDLGHRRGRRRRLSRGRSSASVICRGGSAANRGWNLYCRTSRSPQCVSPRGTAMSALDGADSRPKTEESLPTGAVDWATEGTPAFLTDEVFLYRVVGLVVSGQDEMVELEDCYRLGVVRVPVRELHARRLRRVRPAPANG